MQAKWLDTASPYSMMEVIRTAESMGVRHKPDPKRRLTHA